MEWADGNWLDDTWNAELSQFMGEWEWEDGAWMCEMGEAYWELIEMSIAMEEHDGNDGNDGNDDMYDEYEPVDVDVSLCIDWQGLRHHEFNNIEEQLAENGMLFRTITIDVRTHSCEAYQCSIITEQIVFCRSE